MSHRFPLILLLIALPLWLAASYGARYGFMEDGQWVGICADEASRWECQLRSNLGLMIHFKVLGWAALITSVLAFSCRGGRGGVGGAGDGVRPAGAGVVQHHVCGVCGGDCGVAVGQEASGCLIEPSQASRSGGSTLRLARESGLKPCAPAGNATRLQP